MKISLNIFKSKFVKNVLTLMTGSIIAQAIPIAITPILTRLYLPEDFGIFALFLAITAVTGTIANAQYEQAIILPKEDCDALNLVVLGVFITVGISIVLLLVIVFFSNDIINLLGNNGNIKNWLYLVPVSTLLVGIFNSLKFFNIRKKKFKNVSVSLVSRSTSLSILQVLLGLISIGPLGLILAQIISYFTGNMILFRTIKESKYQNIITKENIKKQAGKYKKFPIYSLPSIFINSVYLNSLNFLISTMFTITTLGFYALTQRMVETPLGIIGNSFRQVYFQQASEAYSNNKNMNKLFVKIFKKLLLISIPIFTVLFFIAEPLFEFVFGEEWRIAGAYAKIIIPLAAIRFVSSPLSVTINIYQKQQILLLINILFLTTTLGVFIVGESYNFSFELVLTYFSIIMSIEYALLLLICWRLSKRNLIKK